MKVSKQSQKNLRLANLAFVALFLVIVGLLQWLNETYHMRFDWTAGSRHSLSDASVAVVKNLDKPVHIAAFVSERSGRRHIIKDLVERYQKVKADIDLEFVDTDKNPDRVRKENILVDGELIVRYGDAKESLTKITEDGLTNALTRIGHRGERWLVFLSGHGERSPDRQANFDLSIWAGELRKRGFQTKALSLGENPQIPTNTTALVIAGPRTRLLNGEVKTIRDYVKNGGNLVWFNDPGKLLGLAPLAEELGLEFYKGMIIDPTTSSITGRASALLLANYNNHPIVKNFDQQTLFFSATGVNYQKSGSWDAQVFLDTRENTWVETGTLRGRLQFDKGQDIAGPISLGLSLSRDHKEKGSQRIVIMGDGDFLSNAYLGNGGNLDLGLSVINWVSGDDDYVSIPVRTAMDQGLELSTVAMASLVVVFLMLFPIALLGGGVFVWLRRRKR